MNPQQPEYEAGMLVTQPQHSVPPDQKVSFSAIEDK
jgi:hypothetical protein